MNAESGRAGLTGQETVIVDSTNAAIVIGIAPSKKAGVPPRSLDLGVVGASMRDKASHEDLTARVLEAGHEVVAFDRRGDVSPSISSRSCLPVKALQMPLRDL